MATSARAPCFAAFLPITRLENVAKPGPIFDLQTDLPDAIRFETAYQHKSARELVAERRTATADEDRFDALARRRAV